MASRQWDLGFWEQANDLVKQAERIQRNFIEVATSSRYQRTRGARAWSPALNLVETERGLSVICALSGVKAENLEIRAEENQLIIRGQRALPDCCQHGHLKLWEIPLGPFERRITLPRGNLFAVTQSLLEDGLLIIELEKRL
jgi:HSP20 family molecular chaperone IbpA